MGRKATVNKDGTLDFSGKTYKPVNHRIKELYEKHPDARLISKRMPDTVVDGKGAVNFVCKLYIGDTLVSSGHSEETRFSSLVNSTSAVENAETSAAGRALALYGFGGDELASADELSTALTSQQIIEVKAEVLKSLELDKEALEAYQGLMAAWVAGDAAKANELRESMSDDVKRKVGFYLKPVMTEFKQFLNSEVSDE